MSTRMVELSVVVPVYGCGGCLSSLHGRLTATLTEIGLDYELVFIDDRSRDDAWDTIREFARTDSRVNAVRLSRNFGQHAAIAAGLAESRGKWTVVMDCDLQEPPEAIPSLYAKAQEGYDVVLTARRGRRESPLRKVLARAYLKFRNLVVGMEVRSDHGTLSMLSRKAVDAFLSMRDLHREYVLMLYWLGFEHATVEFDHAERHEGDSSYTLRHLTRLSIDGLFFQTTALLRGIVYTGFAIAFAGLLLACYFLYAYLVVGGITQGYTSIVVILLLLGGFAIAAIGIVGLYVGKLFDQSKERPLYVVDERLSHGVGAEAPRLIDGMAARRDPVGAMTAGPDD